MSNEMRAAFDKRFINPHEAKDEALQEDWQAAWNAAIEAAATAVEQRIHGKCEMFQIMNVEAQQCAETIRALKGHIEALRLDR